MTEYLPSNKSIEELIEELKYMEEQNKKLTDWPDVDTYDDCKKT